MADQLADAGYVVLRFDYDGMGDSVGQLDDPNRVEAWLDSIRKAAGLLRATGVERVGLVGLRIGGTLAALAAQDENIAALVLWDPVPTGRRFIREQEALKALSIGETEDVGGSGSAELLGMLLPPPLVEQLALIDMTGVAAPFARRTLMVARPDRPVNPRLRCRLTLEDCDWIETVGQAELVDVLPDDAAVPYETIDAISSWLADALDGRPVAVTPPRSTSAIVGHDHQGRPIRERAMTMGPHDLFGILTEPAITSEAPAIVLLNAGLLHHVGPARLWVDLARTWAAHGFRVLRIDLSGIGDSGARPGQPTHLSYPPEALEDIALAVETVSPGDPTNVILGGLCAGAYHAIEAGIALRTRGACMVNPILSFDPPALTPVVGDSSTRQAVQPYNRLFSRLRQNERMVRLGEGVIPPHVWWLLDKLHVQPSPGRGLQSLADAGVNAVLICGEVEALPFTQRARWTMQRLAARGNFRFEVLESTDHTLFGASARARARDMLTAHVVSQFAVSDEALVSSPA